MKKVGRYEIQKEAGRGGMSTVYEAFDPRFQRAVAVKVMTQDLLDNPTLIARFEREARTIASLEHPAIVPVYDFGEEERRPFLVMRLMTGGTLADRLQQGRLSIAQTARILQRIGSALERAHDQGVIHRDLKPSNIMFDQYGDAFLADFGIARLTEEAVTLTGQNVIGTPAYMSPEQIHGDKPVDGRSDIYALGVICFEMLTGRRPFEEKAPAKLMMQHLIDPVPNIRELRPDLPPGVADLISRSMAKSPEERFADAGEMCDTLDSLAAIDSDTATAAKLAAAEAERSAADANAPPASGVEAGAVEVTIPDSAETEVPLLAEAAPEAAREPASKAGAAPSTAGQTAEAGQESRSRWLVIGGIVVGILAIAAGAYFVFGGGFAAGGGAATVEAQPTSAVEESSIVFPDVAATAQTERPDLSEEEAQAVADAHLERFYQAMDEEDYDTAAEALGAAIDLFPEEAWLYAEKAWLEERRGDLDGMLAAINHAVELEPEDNEYIAARGNVRRQLGDLEGALGDHLRAIELEPGSPERQMDLAETYVQLGELDAALEHMDQAVALKDDEAWFFDSRANLYALRGEYDLAWSDFERASELEPDNRFYFTRAADMFLYEADDPNRALVVFTLAVQRLPDDPWVYSDRALAHEALGNHEEALADINRAIEMEPDNAHFYIRRAQFWQNALPDFDAALADLNRAVEIAPDNAEAYSERGAFYQYHTDDLEAALADRSRALELDPEGPWRYHDRAAVLRQLRRDDEALADLDACLELDPDYYWCHWERAWLLADQERAADAVADLERYLELADEDECPDCFESARSFIAENG